MTSDLQDIYPLGPDEFGNPYRVPFPDTARDVGAGPFWQPGDIVRWRFRRHDFALHGTEVVQPMRVVEDSSRGTVLWLPGDTPTVNARLRRFADINPHQIAHADRFRPTATDRIMVHGSWYGTGVLRIVPASMPFSVWLFFSQEGDFKTWYVNLEHRHRKGQPTDEFAAGELFTADHILDLVISPGGAVVRKDEDELAGAVEFGQYTPEVAQHIRFNADIARAAYLSGHWAFGDEWTQWYREEVLGGASAAGTPGKGTAGGGASGAGAPGVDASVVDALAAEGKWAPPPESAIENFLR